MYQQITDNKSYILPCLTQITANHRKQIVYLAMPPQIPPNYRQSYISSCLTQIPINHRQQITRLANASHRYLQITRAKNRSSRMIPANHRQQVVHLVMSHTYTSKSQAANHTSYLQCLKQIPAHHGQQNVLHTMLHRDTVNISYTLLCLTHTIEAFFSFEQDAIKQTIIVQNCFCCCFCWFNLLTLRSNHRQRTIFFAQTLTNQRQQFAHLATPRTDTKNHKQQIVHLAMPHTDTSQSPATKKDEHLSIMPHTDTSKSQATKRTSYQASH